jgi:hypothetical protein
MTSSNQHLYLIINCEITLLFNLISVTHIQRDLNTSVNALSKDITLILEIQFFWKNYLKDIYSPKEMEYFFICNFTCWFSLFVVHYPCKGFL